MYLKIIICLLILISIASARVPVQGDHVAVTVSGMTYYGTVEALQDGLLSLNCTGVSERMLLIYEPRNLLGGKDLNYYPPSIQKIDPIDICVGAGSINQLAWI